MRQIKDFSSFQLSQKLLESKNSDSSLRKLFPGLASGISQAMKYANQRGITHKLELVEDGEEKFPRLVIDGLEHPLDLHGFEEDKGDRESSRIRPADKDALIDSVNDFVRKNNLDAKVQFSDGDFRLGFGSTWPVRFIKIFFDENIDKIRGEIFKTEDVDYKNLPIYKAMQAAGFKDITTPALERRKTIVFSHPLLIDQYKSDGSAINGKISISPNGPIRYSGPSTLPHIIKSGKPLVNKSNYEFSLKQAADALILKTLKSAKVGEPVILGLKKIPTEEVLAKFLDILVSDMPYITWEKTFGKTNLFTEDDFEKIMTPEQLADLKLLSKVRSIMI